MIFKCDSDGEFITSAGGYGSASGQFIYPTDAAVSPDGRIFVTDRWNRRIQIFRASDLKLLETFGEDEARQEILTEPYGVAFFHDSLIVTDRENESLVIFNDRNTLEYVVHPFGMHGTQLQYPGYIISTGEFLAVQTASGQIAILDSLFFIENIIEPTPETGAFHAVHYACGGCLLVSTEKAGACLYRLDGQLLKSFTLDNARTEFRESRGPDCNMIMTDFTTCSFSVVSISELDIKEARDKSPGMTHRDTFDSQKPLTEAQFIARVATGCPVHPDAWPPEYKSKMPGSFRHTIFKRAMAAVEINSEVVEPVIEQCLQTFSTHKTFFTMQNKLESSIRTIATRKMRILAHSETIIPYNNDLYAVDRQEDGGFYGVFYNNGDIIKGYGDSYQEFTSKFDSQVFFIRCLKDGIISLRSSASQTDTIIDYHDMDGTSKRELARINRKENPLNIFIIPGIYKNNLLIPDPSTGKIFIIDMDTGRHGLLGGQYPLVFDSPINVLYDDKKKCFYALQADQTIIVFSEDHVVLRTFPLACLGTGYWAGYYEIMSPEYIISLLFSTKLDEWKSKTDQNQRHNMVAIFSALTGELISVFNTFDTCENNNLYRSSFHSMSRIIPHGNRSFDIFEMSTHKLHKFKFL